MKEAMKRIVDNFHKYNSEHMATLAFGIPDDITYDALVVAPSFSPYKLKMDEQYKVTTLREGAYIAGYLVEKDNLKIAWIKIGSSAGNLIDHLAICAELSFKKVIFIGTLPGAKYTSALKEGLNWSWELCRQECSICWHWGWKKKG